MRAFLSVMRLLAIVVWVGGLIFFAFVVAPVAFQLVDFHELASPHEAGTVVAGTLRVLNRIGPMSGALFLLATGFLFAKFRGRTPQYLLLAQLFLVAGMVAATLYVQLSIVPRMEQDRVEAGGNVEAAPKDDPARLDFEQMHPLSEKVEGTALVLGIGVVVLLGVERSV
jgi:Domain of unknown function (DUF4149)